MHEKRITTRYFLLSFAIGFLVLSVTAMLVVLYIPPQMSTEEYAPADEQGAYLPQNSDSKNFLAVISSPEAAPEDDLFVLLRFDPVRGQLPVSVLPAGALFQTGPQSVSLGSVYRAIGTKPAAERITEELGIAIHHTVRLSRQNTVELVDRLGGVRYTAKKPISLSGESMQADIPAGENVLSGELFYNLLSYRGYEGGEAERCLMAAELVAAAINGSDGMFFGPEGDAAFKWFVNTVDTDINAVSYNELKPAASFLIKLRESPAAAIPISGQSRGSLFYVSRETATALREAFSPPAEVARAKA